MKLASVMMIILGCNATLATLCQISLHTSRVYRTHHEELDNFEVFSASSTQKAQGNRVS
jgi:hypothetical protein